MKTHSKFNLLVVSALVAIIFVGCKAVAEEEQKPKEQDYFELYVTDVERDGLKGRVKSIKDTTFNVSLKFGEVVKVSVKDTRIKEYDEKGRVVKDNTSEYKYSQNDSTLIQDLYTDGVFKIRVVTSYTDKGKISKKHYFNSNNELLYLQVLTYLNDSCLKDISTYGTDGNIMNKYYDIEYDFKNCIIGYKFGRGETLKWGNSVEVTYDANCHIVSQKTYELNSHETVLSKNNGNLIRSIEYNVDLESGKIFSQKNKEYTTFLGEVVISKEEELSYRYEGDWYEKKTTENGYITQTVTSYVEKQELTYDEQDNCVKSVISKNEIPVEMVVRHIEYYE